jgi:aminopeptidase N
MGAGRVWGYPMSAYVFALPAGRVSETGEHVPHSNAAISDKHAPPSFLIELLRFRVYASWDMGAGCVWGYPMSAYVFALPAGRVSETGDHVPHSDAAIPSKQAPPSFFVENF